MPYAAPDLSGIIDTTLVVHKNGMVEADGKKLGWIERLEFERLSTYVGRAHQHPQEYHIRLDMMVTEQQPDCGTPLYNINGKKIGSVVADVFVPEG